MVNGLNSEVHQPVELLSTEVAEGVDEQTEAGNGPDRHDDEHDQLD